YLSNDERSSEAVSICSDFSFVPSGSRNGKVQEYSGTLPTSTKVEAVLYFLSVVSVTVGRFIGAALNADDTLKATVTSANCSPGLVTALTVFVPGGQSRSDALAACSTLVTVASSPGRGCALLAAWPAATTANRADREKPVRSVLTINPRVDCRAGPEY